MKNLCLILLLMLLPACSYAQSDSLERARQDSLSITEAEDFVTASILVATPSDVLYSCVGHACIRMQCPYYDLDMVYTYESEAVKNRVLTFFKGDLKMGMVAVPTERVLADYASEGRGITEYVINIPLEKRKQLWRFLDEKVEEGMNLPYDYLNRSCALMCLHAICMAALPDTITFGKWDERLVGKSRRALFGDQTKDFPWNRFFIFSVTGTVADKTCAVTDKVIIPCDLINVLQKTTFNGQPVLSEANVLVDQTVSIEENRFLTPTVLACILLLLAVISCFCLQRPLSFLFLALQSIIGIGVCYLVVLSSLPNTEFSWLIIPFNPLPLFLWRWRKRWMLPYGVISIIWCVAMLMRIDNPLVDNACIVLAFSLAVNYVGQWFSFKKNKTDK